MATVGIKGLTTVPTEFRKNVFLLDNYTVHEKNCNPVYVATGKQRQLSTKFYAKTDTLNGKQVAKFSKIGQHLQQLQQV